MNKIKSEQWAKIFIGSMVVSAILHQFNVFAPIHEYFHFLHYESQGKFVSWTWNQVKVTKVDHVGLMRGFFGEIGLYAWVFVTIITATNNPVFTPLVVGWAAGCFASAWEYGHKSTDFFRFKQMTAHILPSNSIHDAYNRQNLICLGIMVSAFILFLYRRTNMFKGSKK